MVQGATYTDKARIKQDMCLVVQDIDDGLAYPQKPLDGLLDKFSTCEACHPNDREQGLGLQPGDNKGMKEMREFGRGRRESLREMKV